MKLRNKDQEVEYFSVTMIISSENLNNSASYNLSDDSTTHFKLKSRLRILAKLQKKIMACINKLNLKAPVHKNDRSVTFLDVYVTITSK